MAILTIDSSVAADGIGLSAASAVHKPFPDDPDVWYAKEEESLLRRLRLASHISRWKEEDEELNGVSPSGAASSSGSSSSGKGPGPPSTGDPPGRI